MNVFVAALTAPNTRMKFCLILYRLGETFTCYYTDSIVYIDNGNSTAETGCILGKWSAEIAPIRISGSGPIRVRRVPNSYAYVTKKSEKVVKLKVLH